MERLNSRKFKSDYQALPTIPNCDSQPNPNSINYKYYKSFIHHLHSNKFIFMFLSHHVWFIKLHLFVGVWFDKVYCLLCQNTNEVESRWNNVYELHVLWNETGMKRVNTCLEISSWWNISFDYPFSINYKTYLSFHIKKTFSFSFHI